MGDDVLNPLFVLLVLELWEILLRVLRCFPFP